MSLNTNTCGDKEPESPSTSVIFRDLPLGIFPFPTFRAHATVSKDLPWQIVAGALHAEADTLDEAASNFFLECAQRVIYEQESIYEVKTDVIPDQVREYWTTRQFYGPVRRIELAWHPKDRIEWRDGKLYIEERSAVSASVFQREISKGQYVLIACPRPGGQGIRQICGEISRIENQSSKLVMDYFQNALGDKGSDGPNRSFDYQEHIRNRDVSLLFAAKELGWNFYGSTDKHITTYYLALRMLRCEAFVAGLRESILAGVYEALQIAGSRLGLNARLELTGLPSAQDVQQALACLESGQSISEVLKQLHID